ncbi:hypothetical protein BDZ89DRAFT_1077146 [Hymenopellis radicata]|nr:hypothetical protein BDZ89DRAFT_1077146 [Hymenopellis radicata]
MADPATIGPRIEELLCQNHPLLDVELSAFRKSAEDARAILGDLDSRIVQARELLENLLSARQRAQSRLEDIKSLLHPCIFGHCISKISSDEDPDALDPKGAPWLLARVCHRWRELAVNTPQLWTRLLLDFDTHLGHITERQCAYKTGLFIQRSRGLPMEVYLGSMKSVAAHPVIPALEVSIPQWRYLDVDLPWASLESLSGNSFPSLRALWLRLRSNPLDLHVDVFQPMRVPVLRDFEMIPSESWQALEHVPFPWSHLTSVLRFPAFNVKALNYLRTMAELKELDVLASETRTPVHDVISLPKLRRLNITEDNNAAGRSKEFFSALAIPALSELTLRYYDDEAVLHFPASPLPLGNLIKLDISCEMNSHRENTEHLLNFLALTHHVESLRLYDLNMTVEFAAGLNLDKITDGLPARLPCLQFLDIGNCKFAPTANDFGAEEISNANASRSTGMDGNGRGAATNETGTQFDPRSRLAEDHCRCLKRVRFPRWLYVETRRERPHSFLELTSSVELECGVTTRDIDS